MGRPRCRKIRRGARKLLLCCMRGEPTDREPMSAETIGSLREQREMNVNEQEISNHSLTGSMVQASPSQRDIPSTNDTSNMAVPVLLECGEDDANSDSATIVVEKPVKLVQDTTSDTEEIPRALTTDTTSPSPRGITSDDATLAVDLTDLLSDDERDNYNIFSDTPSDCETVIEVDITSDVKETPSKDSSINDGTDDDDDDGDCISVESEENNIDVVNESSLLTVTCSNDNDDASDSEVIELDDIKIELLDDENDNDGADDGNTECSPVYPSTIDIVHFGVQETLLPEAVVPQRVHIDENVVDSSVSVKSDDDDNEHYAADQTVLMSVITKLHEEQASSDPELSSQSTALSSHDISILKSILNDGNYEISEEDKIALQNVIDSETQDQELNNNSSLPLSEFDGDESTTVTTANKMTHSDCVIFKSILNNEEYEISEEDKETLHCLISKTLLEMHASSADVESTAEIMNSDDVSSDIATRESGEALLMIGSGDNSTTEDDQIEKEATGAEAPSLTLDTNEFESDGSIMTKSVKDCIEHFERVIKGEQGLTVDTEPEEDKSQELPMTPAHVSSEKL